MLHSRNWFVEIWAFCSSLSFTQAQLGPALAQVSPERRMQRGKGRSSQRWIAFTATTSNCGEQRNEHFLAEKKIWKANPHVYGVFLSLVHALTSGGCGHTSPLAVAEPAAELSAACLSICCCTAARLLLIFYCPQGCTQALLLYSEYFFFLRLSCFIWLKRVEEALGE